MKRLGGNGKNARKSLKTAKHAPNKRGTNPKSLANLDAHKFKKGVSGNPGGRPKLLGESYKEYLATIDAMTGRTRAEDIAQAMGEAALKGDVSAAREIRAATEGDKIRTWRDDVIDLLKARTLTPQQVAQELGVELASELSIAAGIARIEGGEIETGGAQGESAAAL